MPLFQLLDAPTIILLRNRLNAHHIRLLSQVSRVVVSELRWRLLTAKLYLVGLWPLRLSARQVLHDDDLAFVLLHGPLTELVGVYGRLDSLGLLERFLADTSPTQILLVILAGLCQARSTLLLRDYKTVFDHVVNAFAFRVEFGPHLILSINHLSCQIIPLLLQRCYSVLVLIL